MVEDGKKLHVTKHMTLCKFGTRLMVKTVQLLDTGQILDRYSETVILLEGCVSVHIDLYVVRCFEK